jgi:hypothetical protein
LSGVSGADDVALKMIPTKKITIRKRKRNMATRAPAIDRKKVLIGVWSPVLTKGRFDT